MHIVFHYYLETLRLDNSTLSIQHWDYRNAFLYSLIQANDFFLGDSLSRPDKLSLHLGPLSFQSQWFHLAIVKATC